MESKPTIAEILEPAKAVSNKKGKSLADRILQGEFCGNKMCPANIMNLAKATIEGNKLGKCQGHTEGNDKIRGKK